MQFIVDIKIHNQFTLRAECRRIHPRIPCSGERSIEPPVIIGNIKLVDIRRTQLIDDRIDVSVRQTQVRVKCHAILSRVTIIRAEIVCTDRQMIVKAMLECQVEGLLHLIGIDWTIERIVWVTRVEHVIADDCIAHPRVVIMDGGGCLLREVMAQPHRPDVSALIFQIGAQLIPIRVLIGRRIIPRPQWAMHASIAKIRTGPLLECILHIE